MPTTDFVVSRSRVASMMAKIESTYGTDSAPGPTTDGILTFDSAVKATVEASTMEFISEGSENFTHGLDIIGQTFVNVRFKTLFAGSGTRGVTAVGWTALGALLQACGMTYTINAATSLVFAPAAISALKSCTIWLRHGAWVHKVAGCVGNVVMRGTPNTGLECTFDMKGLYVAPVAVAAIFDSWSGGTARALPFRGVAMAINNGSAMLPAAVGKSFTFDRGLQIGQIENFNMSTGIEAMLIEDAKPTLEIVIAKDDHGDQIIDYADWYADMFASTTHAVSFTLGSASGNTAAFSFPTVQVLPGTNPTAAGSHLDMTVKYKVQHATANSEFGITVT